MFVWGEWPTFPTSGRVAFYRRAAHPESSRGLLFDIPLSRAWRILVRNSLANRLSCNDDAPGSITSQSALVVDVGFTDASAQIASRF